MENEAGPECALEVSEEGRVRVRVKFEVETSYLLILFMWSFMEQNL